MMTILIIIHNFEHICSKKLGKFVPIRVESRANYFQKIGGCPKSEAPKKGHKISKSQNT